MRDGLRTDRRQGKHSHYVVDTEAHGFAAQKKSLHAVERDSARVRQARDQFGEQTSFIDPRQLIFIDESGVNLAMTRLYGRAPRGERVSGTAPHNYGPNVTVVGALGLDGIRAAMSFEGAMNGRVYRVFVEQVLAPTLKAGDVVVMDNLSAHKVKGIKEIIEQRGAKALYLPPYSPEFNPIEQCWSKVKTSLRKAKARTVKALNEAIDQAMDRVTSSDAIGWFRHCGYGLNPI